MLDKPIKTLGLHQVRVVLHPEVSVHVTVNVAQSAEEAEMQAKGIDPLRLAEEAATARRKNSARRRSRGRRAKPNGRLERKMECTPSPHPLSPLGRGTRAKRGG